MNLWNTTWTPMLLKEVEQPFDSSSYFYELKFDGIRAIIYVNQKSIKIVNRHGVDITNFFPELERIKELVNEDTIFDGEIISMENGLPSFKKVSSRIHLKDEIKIKNYSINDPVIFIAFDILYKRKDLINLPLQKRKSILNKYPDNDCFLKSKVIKEKGLDLFKYVQKIGLEGIVAKEKNSQYIINERTSNWLKIKNIKKEKFLIGGYIKNKNNTISLLLGEYQNKKLYFVGKVLLTEKNKLYFLIISQKRLKTSPFINYQEKAIYLKPNIKREVSFLERTSNNHLRHPKIK